MFWAVDGLNLSLLLIVSYDEKFDNERGTINWP